MESKIIQRVRLPKIRPPEASPKEQEAWQNFLAMAEHVQGDGEELSPIVRAELERLVAKGNPLATRLQQRIDAANFRPRAADVEPLPPPKPRRISRLQWGRPDVPGDKNRT